MNSFPRTRGDSFVGLGVIRLLSPPVAPSTILYGGKMKEYRNVAMEASTEARKYREKIDEAMYALKRGIDEMDGETLRIKEILLGQFPIVAEENPKESPAGGWLEELFEKLHSSIRQTDEIRVSLSKIFTAIKKEKSEGK